MVSKEKSGRFRGSLRHHTKHFEQSVHMFLYKIDIVHELQKQYYIQPALFKILYEQHLIWFRFLTSDHCLSSECFFYVLEFSDTQSTRIGGTDPQMSLNDVNYTGKK